MKQILIAYGTRRGATKDSAEVIAQALRKRHGHTVDLTDADEAPPSDLRSYDTVIVGNTFSQTNSFNDADVYLGEGTRDSIVGSQNARTEDYGTGNRKL